MRLPKFSYLIVFLFLFACSSTPQPTERPLTPTQRDLVVLPPTWTPTASVVPSQTPIRPPTQTFTPFPSVTPLPATLTSSPTSDVPTLTPTATITPTADTSCYVFALEEGVNIYSAPFIDPYRVLPTMSPTITYQAASIYEPYYELTLNEETIGWVDYRPLTLASQGPGCNFLPIDERELTDFPSLCFFSADGELETFTDRALSEPYENITSTVPYVLLVQYSDVFYTSLSEDGPSFFVDADQVSTSGNCDTVPFAGLTIRDGFLWSQPDGEKGEQLEELTRGKRIYIQEGPVKGPNPPSFSGDGSWYFVMVSPQRLGIYGWVWSSQIMYD